MLKPGDRIKVGGRNFSAVGKNAFIFRVVGRDKEGGNVFGVLKRFLHDSFRGDGGHSSKISNAFCAGNIKRDGVLAQFRLTDAIGIIQGQAAQVDKVVGVCLDCGAAFIQDLGGAGNDIRGENRFVIGEVAANSGTDFIYRSAAVIMADDGRCVGGISENESIGGIHFAASFHDSIYSEVVGGKCLADFAVGGEDGAVVGDIVMQAGTQGAEDCIFIVVSGRFVIIALPGSKVVPDCFGFPIILEEGGDIAGIILLPKFGKTDIAIDTPGHVIGDFLFCGADSLFNAADFVVLQFHRGLSFQSEKDCGAFIEGLAEGIGDCLEVCGVFVGQRRIDGAAGKGFKLAAGDGAGIGQLGEFDEGIGGVLGLVEGEGIQHFGLDLGIANGFNQVAGSGDGNDFAVGDGVGNDADGGQVRDGFQRGKVAVAGCGFIVDRERGGLGVGEVINNLDTHVNIVRGILFDGVDAGVQNVRHSAEEIAEVIQRLGFMGQVHAGALAGLRSGLLGIVIANDGGKVKGIGEGESVKRVNHFLGLPFIS